MRAFHGHRDRETGVGVFRRGGTYRGGGSQPKRSAVDANALLMVQRVVEEITWSATVCLVCFAA